MSERVAIGANLRASLLALCWLSACCCAVASADAPRANLTWHKPALSMCPTAAAVESDVEQLLGRSVFVASSEAELRVHGEAEESATGALVRVEVRDRYGAFLGKRELTAAAGQCASLRRPLSLVLTLLLEHELARVAPPRSLQLGPSIATSTGVLPRAGVGLGVEAALDPVPWWRLRADATYWLPVAAETARGVGANFQAISAGLVACPRLWRGDSAGFWLCAGARVGALHATPRGVPQTERSVRVLGQAALELAWAWQLPSRAAITAAAGALITPTRPPYYVERADSANLAVHRPALLSAIFRLGLTIGGP